MLRPALRLGVLAMVLLWAEVGRARNLELSPPPTAPAAPILYLTAGLGAALVVLVHLQWRDRSRRCREPELGALVTERTQELLRAKEEAEARTARGASSWRT